MKQIKKIYLRRIGQQYAYRFFENAYELMKLIADDKFQRVLPAYQKAVATYAEVMKPSSNSLLTMQIAIESECRDTLCNLISEKTKELLVDPVPRTREIGKKIDSIFAAYARVFGEVPNKEKTELLERFIAELTEKLSVADLNLVDFISTVAELNRSNWSLSELLKMHTYELNGSLLTLQRMEARKEMEKAYMDCITFINAMLVYNGDREFGDIIDQINQLVEQAMEEECCP
jgi:hypothetical protein